MATIGLRVGCATQELASSSKPLERAIAQLADQVSQLAADVNGLKKADAHDKALRKRLQLATPTQYVGGAALPNQVPLMDQYTYLQGTVVPEAQPFRFVKDLGSTTGSEDDPDEPKDGDAKQS